MDHLKIIHPIKCRKGFITNPLNFFPEKLWINCFFWRKTFAQFFGSQEMTKNTSLRFLIEPIMEGKMFVQYRVD